MLAFPSSTDLQKFVVDMIDMMDVEESDLSFASILLGFRQSIDSQDEFRNLATVTVNLLLQYGILSKLNYSNAVFYCDYQNLEER